MLSSMFTPVPRWAWSWHTSTSVAPLALWTCLIHSDTTSALHWIISPEYSGDMDLQRSTMILCHVTLNLILSFAYLCVFFVIQWINPEHSVMHSQLLIVLSNDQNPFWIPLFSVTQKKVCFLLSFTHFLMLQHCLPWLVRGFKNGFLWILFLSISFAIIKNEVIRTQCNNYGHR